MSNFVVILMIVFHLVVGINFLIDEKPEEAGACLLAVILWLLVIRMNL